MRKARRNLVEKLVQDSISMITKSRLSKEEIIIYLSELLTRIGYSFYYRYERPEARTPEGKLEGREIESLWLSDPTAGSSLMKLGYDIYDALLKRAGRYNRQ